MMAGFTGPELAALLEAGTLLVTEPRTSAQMTMTVMSNSHIPMVRSMTHWIDAVYLITRVEPPDEDEQDPDGGEGILAVCLTQPVAEERMAAVNPDGMGRVRALHAALQSKQLPVRLHHFVGGPCAPGLCVGIACLPCLPEGQLPPGLSLLRVDGGAWVFGGLDSVLQAVVADLGADAREPKPERVVQCFWGTAGWTRTQLLGEIARGSWGVCPCTRADVFDRDMSAGALYGEIVESDRIIYAPKNEMMAASEDYEEEDEEQAHRPSGAELEDQMRRHREQLRRQLLQQQEQERQRAAAVQQQQQQQPDEQQPGEQQPDEQNPDEQPDGADMNVDSGNSQ